MAATNGVAPGDTQNSNISPTTFSYAQAAKGKTTVIASPILPVDTPSMSSKASKDSVSSPSQQPPQDSKFDWAEDAADASTVVDEQAQAEQVVEKDTTNEASKTVANGMEEGEGSSKSSPVFAATNSSSTAKDETPVPAFADPEILSWRKRPDEAAPVAEPWSGTAPSVKSEEEASKIESPPQLHLVEAPVPTVNVWTQRAQTTKAKLPSVPHITVPKSEATSAPTTALLGSDLGQTKPSKSKTQAATEESPPNASKGDAIHRRASYPRINGGGSAQHTRNAGNLGSSNDHRSIRVSATSVANRTAAAPLKDVQLWPTPDSAQDKDKPKVHEKTEKPEEKATTSVRKADKWEKVDFTPTVKFETPLPSLGARRGGKSGTRGGRDFGGRGNLSQAPSKPASATSPATDEPKEQRTDFESSVPSSERRKSSRPFDAVERHNAHAKRSSVPNEQHLPARYPEQRNRHSQVNSAPSSATDPSGSFDTLTPSSSFDDRARGSQNTVEATRNHGENGQHATYDVRQRRKNSRTADNEAFGFRNGERRRSDSINGNGRAFLQDRRADTFPRQFESRDAAPSYPQRERGDRERMRGGRMRGGPSPQVPSTPHQNSNGPISPNGLSLSARSATFQQGFPAGFPNQRPARGHTHRPASMPTEAAYSRYGPVYPSTPQFAPFLNGTFDYNAAPQMSPATNYNPYMPHMMLFNGVATQLNYYFSVDNLCKDMFLRQHMDSQGFVALKFIADFARMKVLTTDMDVVRTVAEQSPDYQIRQNSNGELLIRKATGWEKFVLAMKDRDISARHEGPPAPTPLEPVADYRSPNEQLSSGEVKGFTPISTTTFELPQPSLVSGSPTDTLMGSQDAAVKVNENHSSQALTSTEKPTVQNTAPEVDTATTLEEPDTFPDDKIDHLTVVVRPRAPLHSEASRSFSNGSLEEFNPTANGTCADERQSRSVGRSDGSDHDNLSNKLADIKKTLASPPSSHKRTASNNPVGLFWIKEQGEESEHLPPNSTYIPYGQVCANAIEQRRSAVPGHCPYDMTLLYQFWSHFLLRNFNTRMYVDFRTFAHEDSAQASQVGMDNLIKYYGESLLSSRTIRRSVAQDYVDLVKNETKDGDRPGFRQLRATWRNGAFNIKNRKVITQLTDQDLRTELDR